MDREEHSVSPHHHTELLKISYTVWALVWDVSRSEDTTEDGVLS